MGYPKMLLNMRKRIPAGPSIGDRITHQDNPPKDRGEQDEGIIDIVV
jgi:hypothetical protein